MDNLPEVIRLAGAMSAQHLTEELLRCNEQSARFGLALTEKEIGELLRCREEALRQAGRVEFGGSILPKIIRAFCDSPYLLQENYAETLAQLQEAFYYYKTESRDTFTDDELIEDMVRVFNGRAQGSAEYLVGTSLAELCRYGRRDHNEHDAEEAGDMF